MLVLTATVQTFSDQMTPSVERWRIGNCERNGPRRRMARGGGDGTGRSVASIPLPVDLHWGTKDAFQTRQKERGRGRGGSPSTAAGQRKEKGS